MESLGSFRSTKGNWQEKDNYFWVRGKSENNFLTTVKWGSNFAKQVGTDCCFVPSNSWSGCSDWLQHWQRVKQISFILPESEWFPNNVDPVVMTKEREIGSDPLFCLELFRPNFLINKTSTRLQVSLAICYAGTLFKLSATFTYTEWNRWNCVHWPSSM